MLHILTFATDPQKITLNHPVTNIGLNKPWKGFIDRLLVVRRYLATLPDTDIVCFTDAYDAVILNPDTILPTFLSLNTDILFSAETSCYPWAHVASMYPPSPTKYRYLNAGGYIGYVWALKQILADTNAIQQSPCDQGFLTYVFLQKQTNQTPIHMKLDINATLFQTAYAVPWSDFQVRNGVFHNIVQNTTPSIIHYNGNQFQTTDPEVPSIIPILHGFLANKTEIQDFSQYNQKHPTVAPYNLEADATIRSLVLVTTAIAHYVAPDPATILTRDRDNYHAIYADGALVSPATNPDETLTRGLTEWYLRNMVERDTILDISMHDFVGYQMNVSPWPHSILSFSTLKSDHHNILIPDLYAMQNYKGMLDTPDGVPTLQKPNRMLFIGSTTGKPTPSLNQRVALCRLLRTSEIYPDADGFISEIVNFSPTDAAQIKNLLYPKGTMTIAEQQTHYRHILCIDGNTACWDRVPWALASKCICWIHESDHQCWYYPLLKPWVHYVPFTLANLEETWAQFKDDTAAQLRMVQNANQFARDFLSPHAHALYLWEVIKAIEAKKTIIGYKE